MNIICDIIDVISFGSIRNKTYCTTFNFLLIATVITTVFFSSSVFADSKRFSANIKDPVQTSNNLKEAFEGKTDTVSFSANLFQYGRLYFDLKVNNVASSEEIKTFSGTIFSKKAKKSRDKRREYKVAAASVFKDQDKLKLKVYFNLQTRKNFTRFYELNFTAGDTKAHIVTAPQFALAGKVCGDEKSHGFSALSAGTFETGSSNTSAFITSPVTYREAGISTDTDCNASASFGSSANSKVAGFVNAASTIYQRDLGVTLKINSQRNQTNCGTLSSTDSETLLVAYQNLANSNGYQNTANANFLFTGKDIDSNVIGLAYLGVVCSAPTYAYGLVQHVNDSLDHVIFAHELGHSFGADHTSSGIMAPSLGNNPLTNFNSTSINEILSFISTDAQCLATVDDSNPTPAPTATPDPSNPATPAPTATPDPNDPDGGSTGGGTFAPYISFSGKQGSRSLKGTVKLEQFIDGCTITFRASNKSTNVEKGRLIDEVLPVSENTVIKASFKRRLNSGRNIYFVALHSCPGLQKRASDIVKVDTSRLRVNRSSSFSGVINTTTFGYYGF